LTIWARSFSRSLLRGRFHTNGWLGSDCFFWRESFGAAVDFLSIFAAAKAGSGQNQQKATAIAAKCAKQENNLDFFLFIIESLYYSRTFFFGKQKQEPVGQDISLGWKPFLRPEKQESKTKGFMAVRISNDAIEGCT
jgi:hypothetical protein